MHPLYCHFLKAFSFLLWLDKRVECRRSKCDGFDCFCTTTFGSRTLFFYFERKHRICIKVRTFIYIAILNIFFYFSRLQIFPDCGWKDVASQIIVSSFLKTFCSFSFVHEHILKAFKLWWVNWAQSTLFDLKFSLWTERDSYSSWTMWHYFFLKLESKSFSCERLSNQMLSCSGFLILLVFVVIFCFVFFFGGGVGFFCLVIWLFYFFYHEHLDNFQQMEIKKKIK